MKINGINHITLSCTNVEVAFNFYKDILDLKPLMKWERGAYLLAGDLWVCLSLDKDFSPAKSRGHIAFNVDEEEFKLLKRCILDTGVEEWTKNTSEGDSFYFLDPDGNQLEIHVGDWKSRLDRVKKSPYPGKIEFFE